MQATEDSALLCQYAENHSDEAFATLVTRHVNLVYSVALRHVGDAHQAEEITQAVFIILAKKALQLRHDKALSSWLFRATRLTANNFVRSEARRHRREQEAYMQTVLNESGEVTWQRIEPLLDAAVGVLNEQDRRAIVLRFYEGRSLSEVGTGLGASEDAAKKRVARALERLQRYFSKRGVTSTTATLARAISANSVQVAPVALAKAVTAVGIAKGGGAATTSTLTLVKGALKIMAWAKVQTVGLTAAIVILAAGTATVAIKDVGAENGKPRAETSHVTGSVMNTYLDKENFPSADALSKAPPVLAVQTTHFPQINGGAMWYILPNTNLVQAIGRNTTLISVLEAAYGFKEARMVLPSKLPDTNYDFMATLPNCPRKAFQDEIEQRTGFRAHAEMAGTDVLLLETKSRNAPGLKAATSLIRGMRHQWGDEVYCATNLPISDLADFLENSIYKRPVIDATRLTDHYDIDIKWESQGKDTLKQVLLDQLGLELVPTNMPIHMLMVEKTK